jgi:hypothetical protein
VTSILSTKVRVPAKVLSTSPCCLDFGLGVVISKNHTALERSFNAKNRFKGSGCPGFVSICRLFFSDAGTNSHEEPLFYRKIIIF